MKQTKEISGTVKWIDLEGGFFGIKGDDGVDYFPVEGLPAKARVNGLKIRAKIKSSKVISIQMWGNPVVLSDINI